MALPLHTPELHSERLNALCRICGGKSFDKNHPKLVRKCSQFTCDIERLYGINISEEVNCTAFSKSLCCKCDSRLRNIKKRGDPSAAILKKVFDQIRKSQGIWKSFDAALHVTDCTVCSLFKTCTSKKEGSQCATQTRRRLFETLKARKADNQDDSTMSSESGVFSESFDSSPTSATSGSSAPVHARQKGPCAKELVADLWTNSSSSSSTKSKKENSLRPIDQLTLPLTKQVS